MAFSINEFKSGIKFDLYRPNLFQIQIFNPVNSAGDNQLPVMAMGSDIPGSNLGTMQVPFMGRTIKLAGDRQFESWSVRIINDEDFLIRNAMEEWNNAINKHEQNTRTIEDYKSTGSVYALSKMGGEVLRSYEFVGIYPARVSPMNVQWGPNDEFSTFQVDFEYDYWIPGGPTGDAGGV